MSDASKQTDDLSLTLDHTPGWHLLSWRHVGPYATKMHGFAELLTRLPSDFVQKGWGPIIGIYQSDPATTPLDRQVYLAGCAVPYGATCAELESTRIPPLRCAIYRHIGAYDTIPGKFDRIFSRELRKLRVWPGAAPPFEIYHDDPKRIGSDALRTDLCIPLK